MNHQNIQSGHYGNQQPQQPLIINNYLSTLNRGTRNNPQPNRSSNNNAIDHQIGSSSYRTINQSSGNMNSEAAAGAQMPNSADSNLHHLRLSSSEQSFTDIFLY